MLVNRTFGNPFEVIKNTLECSVITYANYKFVVMIYI